MSTIYIVTQNGGGDDCSGSVMLKAFYNIDSANRYAKEQTDSLPYLHQLVDDMKKHTEENPEPKMREYDDPDQWDYHFMKWHEDRDKFIETFLEAKKLAPFEKDYVKLIIHGWSHADQTSYTVTELEVV